MIFHSSRPLFCSEAALPAEEPDVYYKYLSKKQFYRGGFIATGAMILLDRDTRNHLFPYRDSDPSVDLRRMGDVGQKSGLVFGTLFGVHGILFRSPKSRTTSLLSFEAYILSGLAAAAIKMAVGRERPVETGNPLKFGKHSSDSSFPSGHTTVAFAAATIVAEQYPHWYVEIPLYGGAMGLGFSRMYANKHWMSDVIGGAMLGTAVAHSLRRHHLKKKKETAWIIVPDANGVKFVKKW